MRPVPIGMGGSHCASPCGESRSGSPVGQSSRCTIVTGGVAASRIASASGPSTSDTRCASVRAVSSISSTRGALMPSRTEKIGRDGLLGGVSVSRSATRMSSSPVLPLLWLKTRCDAELYEASVAVGPLGRVGSDGVPGSDGSDGGRLGAALRVWRRLPWIAPRLDGIDALGTSPRVCDLAVPWPACFFVELVDSHLRQERPSASAASDACAKARRLDCWPCAASSCIRPPCSRSSWPMVVRSNLDGAPPA